MSAVFYVATGALLAMAAAQITTTPSGPQWIFLVVVAGAAAVTGASLEYNARKRNI